MADWSSISALATAGGTLALAAATFSAVRSSNRSARIAEQALQEQRRPLLVHTRLDDPRQKMMFVDGHWVQTEGAHAVVEDESGVVYLALPIRNVGTGIAVLQGWHVWPEMVRSDVLHPPAEEFRRQTRDIFVAPGDMGIWQGALRDREDIHDAISRVAAERQPFSIDLLYSDQVGEQRAVSRFTVTPAGDGRWLTNVGLHWNLDRPGPR